MDCSLSHTVDEIKASVQKQIEEDNIRQQAIIDVALQFDSANTTKDDVRKAYQECKDIPEEKQHVRKIIKDTSEDDHFTRSPWLSAVEYLNAEGGIASGGDMKTFCRNEKLEKAAAVIKYCTPNALEVGFSTSNLVDLCGKLSEAFALDPLVFEIASVRAAIPYGGGDRISPNLSSKSLIAPTAVTSALAAMDPADISVTGSIAANADVTAASAIKDFDDKFGEILSPPPYGSLDRIAARTDTLPKLGLGSKLDFTLDIGCVVMECTAYDLAIDDVIDALDSLLQQEKIQFNAYLKIVRLLSRLQFVDRATSVKVYVVLTSMASRAHQFFLTVLVMYQVVGRVWQNGVVCGLSARLAVV
ncbi:RNA-directed DNA polymerase, eukaryota [Tanacetum coccineum]